MTQQAVDWFAVLWDLIHHGHKLVHVERRTGIPESTLRRYLDGSQPPHWRGELLIEMWCTACRKARTDMPLTRVVITPRVVESQSQVHVCGKVAKELSDVWR